MLEPMIQMNELLKLFKVSRGTIYEWIRGDFPKPIKIGHKNFWKRSEIEEYLAKMKKEERWK